MFGSLHLPLPLLWHHIIWASVAQVLIATGLFFPHLSNQRSNTDRITKLSQYRGENIPAPSSPPPMFLFLMSEEKS